MADWFIPRASGAQSVALAGATPLAGTFGAQIVFDGDTRELVIGDGVQQGGQRFKPYSALVDTQERRTRVGENVGQKGRRATFFGYKAGANVDQAGSELTGGPVGLTDGYGIVAIGSQVMSDGDAPMRGNYTIAIGHQAMELATGGYCCTAMGLRAGQHLADGSGYITALGCDAGRKVTTSTNSLFVGAKSAYGATGDFTGDAVCAVGNSSCYNITTAQFVVAVGNQAFFNLTSGGSGTAVGFAAGRDVTNSPSNTFVGYYAGYRHVTGSGVGQNTVMGASAMSAADTEGQQYQNTVMGASALAAYKRYRAIAVGAKALELLVADAPSVAIGFNAGGKATTAQAGTYIGNNAGAGVTVGNGNTAVGDGSMAIASGTECVAVGRDALSSATGAQCTAVGYRAHNTASDHINSASFGYGAQPTASNQVTLGDGRITALRCAQTTITALSDQRYKADISEAPAALGLDLVRALPVKTFRWDRRFKDTPENDDPQLGMIAQEWDAVLEGAGFDWLRVIDKSNPDRWEAAPHKLFFSLMLAIQQQDDQIAALTDRVAALEAA